jgi:hypothetical protein
MASLELNDSQQIRFDLLSVVGYDTAAAAEAIKFVQDDALKYRLFVDQFQRVYSETETVARTLKAVQSATEALTLLKFNSYASINPASVPQARLSWHNNRSLWLLCRTS